MKFVEWPESIADAEAIKQMAMLIVVVICTVVGMILAGTAGYYICQLKKAKMKGKAALPFSTIPSFLLAGIHLCCIWIRNVEKDLWRQKKI